MKEFETITRNPQDVSFEYKLLESSIEKDLWGIFQKRIGRKGRTINFLGG